MSKKSSNPLPPESGKPSPPPAPPLSEDERDGRRRMIKCFHDTKSSFLVCAECFDKANKRLQQNKKLEKVREKAERYVDFTSAYTSVVSTPNAKQALEQLKEALEEVKPWTQEVPDEKDA